MNAAPRILATAAAILALCAVLSGPGAAQPPTPEEDAPVPAADRTVQEALRHLAAGEAEAAVTVLEPLRDAPGTSAPMLALLGTAYLDAGRGEDALAVLTPLAEAEDADPAVLYNAGRAALATGDPERAEAYLERSLDLQSGTPAARELGLLRGQQGRFRDAYRLLRPWLSEHPRDTEARMAAALAALRLERIADAEEMLEGLPMDSPRTRLLWGKLLMMRADPGAAVAVLKPALEESTGEEELDILRTLAEAYTTVGQAEEAVELLQGHSEGHPATALLLAKAQYQTGELERAIETLAPFAEQLLQVVSRRGGGGMSNVELAADFALEYGHLLSTAGRWGEALPYLRLATEVDSGQKEGWQVLGQTLAALDRRDEATAALDRFRELAEAEGPPTERAERQDREAQDPTGREIGRALELLEEDRPEEALGVLRSEKELAPDDIRVWLLESRILLFEERPGEALEVAEEVVRRFPDYVDSYYQRGTALLALEQFDPAEEDFRRALELDPDHVPSMNDLAVLLTVQGRKAEALRLLERVLELNPDDSRARENLERLEEGGPG